jgi:hypothetical protein
MNIWKHTKECIKETAPFIISYGLGTMLFAWLGGSEELDFYLYGCFQFAVGTMFTWSYLIRKQQREKGI